MASPKRIDGKLAILIVVILGVSGAAGGWWYQQNQQRRPLERWGRDAAQLFLKAPRVELLRLTPAAPTASLRIDVVTADGERFHATDRINVSQAPGFLHLRHSLVSDNSFDWSTAEKASRATWRYALHFVDGDHAATLLIADDYHTAMLAETGAQVSIGPLASAIDELFSEQMKDEGVRS